MLKGQKTLKNYFFMTASVDNISYYYFQTI